MQIQKDISLKPFNTFGIDVKAAFFAEIKTDAELREIIQSKEFSGLQKLILGGGSNILFTKNFEGLVIHNSMKGISIVNETPEFLFIQSGAGEVWHELVVWCVNKNLGGIENLSLIPGSVGAGPIQNIGAYGVELKDVFHSLEAIHIQSGDAIQLANADCHFGYRDSIFKNEYKGQYIITSVTLKLSKNPTFNTSYGAIEQELKKMGVEKSSVKAISEAVCNIRRSKLPDPAKIGNAGSFFKNPEIADSKFQELKSAYEKIVAYPLANGNVKLAAGWLIEQCGWRGKVVGHTGSHKDQALVLVNYGSATGNEIYSLALEIQKSVMEKFGVRVETEVNVM